MLLASTWLLDDNHPGNASGFLLAKFRENVNRDKRNLEALMNNGWRVMVVWECSLRGKTADPDLVARQLLDFLESETRFFESRTVRDVRHIENNLR